MTPNPHHYARVILKQLSAIRDDYYNRKRGIILEMMMSGVDDDPAVASFESLSNSTVEELISLVDAVASVVVPMLHDKYDSEERDFFRSLEGDARTKDEIKGFVDDTITDWFKDLEEPDDTEDDDGF